LYRLIGKTYKKGAFVKKIIILSLCITSPNALLPMLQEDAHKLEQQVHEGARILADIIAPELEEKIEGEQPAIAQNTHKKQKAVVRQDKTISAGERAVLKKRKPSIRAALYKHIPGCLDILKNRKTPITTIKFSGGGYRAMLCCLGSLLALEKSKLLKTIAYMCGLSGSTWAIAPWITTKMSLEDFTEYIYTCIEQPLYKMTEHEACLAADMFAVRRLSKQSRTLIDLYSAGLGNRLLAHMGDNRHITHLSDQAEIIESGAYPYPIYTAVSGNESDEETSWYTLTPHEVTNMDYNLSIPPYGFGRTYDKGESTNNVPEIPLSISVLGTCGSAFAANFDTTIDAAEDRDPQDVSIFEELKKILGHKGKERAIPCELKLPNFTAGMDTPLSKHHELQLVDAGTDFNLPYPATSGLHPERKSDIIFLFDNSAGPLGKQLQACEQWARKHGTHFPSISLENIDKKTIRIFEGGQDDPLVIYMPGISDPDLWKQHKDNPAFKDYNLSGFDLKKETEEGFCQTQYFKYSPELAKKVVRQTEFNLLANRDVITQAMLRKIKSMPEKK